MQECVTEDHECQGDLAEMSASFARARAALTTCLGFLGSDASVEGVMGAVAAALTAVEVARVWWRRHHGETGPAFPLDRYVDLLARVIIS
jgi:hypothetical protein